MIVWRCFAMSRFRLFNQPQNHSIHTTKTPLISISHKKYGSFQQLTPTGLEITEYSSFFLNEFSDLIINLIKSKTTKIYRVEQTAAYKCKGSLELIKIAEDGNFQLLAKHLESYPLPKTSDISDNKELLFLNHLLFAAVKSGNLNTIFTVIQYLSNHVNLKLIKDLLHNNLTQFSELKNNPLKHDKTFKKYIKVLKLLSTITLLRKNAIDINSIGDISCIKQLIKKELENYITQLTLEISQNPNNKKLIKQKQEECKILSELKHKILNAEQQENLNTTYHLLSMIVYPVFKPCLENISIDMVNLANRFIDACTIYHCLQDEKYAHEATVKEQEIVIYPKH